MKSLLTQYFRNVKSGFLLRRTVTTANLAQFRLTEAKLRRVENLLNCPGYVGCRQNKDFI